MGMTLLKVLPNEPNYVECVNFEKQIMYSSFIAIVTAYYLNSRHMQNNFAYLNWILWCTKLIKNMTPMLYMLQSICEISHFSEMTSHYV